MNLWLLSPLIFAAGFALLYSKELVARISGGCLAIAALVAAWKPDGLGPLNMAVVLGIIGCVGLFAIRPTWLRVWLDQSDNPPLE